jgi:hypothetical protein
LDSGEIKISGKVWPYAIWSTDNFFGPAKDFVQDKGFPTNQPFLVGTISKVIDHTLGEALGGTKLAIYYIEDRRISGLIRSSSDSAQFMDRCLKAVQFLKDERTPEKVILEPSIPFEEQLLAQGYKQLNATEIKATLSGNTAHGRFEGNTFTVYLGADGQMRGVSTSSPGKVDRDRGRWEASPDDMFCDKWDKWRSASDCDRVYLHGSKLILVNPDGTKSSELVLEQGNSRGL